MSSWTELFPAEQIAQVFEQAIQAQSSAKIENLNDKQRGDVSRLMKVTRVLYERFKRVDLELLPRNAADNVRAHVNALLSHSVNFANSGGFGHVDHANNAADVLLSVILGSRTTASKIDLKAVSDTARAFNERIDSMLVESANKTKSALDEIAKLSTLIENGKSRIEEANRSIEQQKGRLDKAIADFQAQYSESEAKRSSESTKVISAFQEALQEQRKENEETFEAALKKMNSSYDLHYKKVDEETTRHLKFLEGRRDEVNKIFDAIGSTSMSGHFGESADKERGSANWLRIVALVLMAGMVAVGVLAFKYSVDHQEVDWRMFAFRLGTTIIIAIPAVYAAQESSKHRDRERKLRTLQLELASIDAYLALLPIEKQHELKANLTEHFFGREEALEPTDDVSKHALFDVLKTAIGNLTKNK